MLVLLTCGASLTSLAANDAAAIWSDKCAKCHSVDGSGNTKMGKKLRIRNYTDTAVQASFTDSEAFKAIKEGTKDEKGTTRMKAIEGLADEEITLMVQYVRNLKK